MKIINEEAEKALARYEFLIKRLHVSESGDGSGFWVDFIVGGLEANHFIGKRPGGAPRDVEEALDAMIAEEKK